MADWKVLLKISELLSKYEFDEAIELGKKHGVPLPEFEDLEVIFEEVIHNTKEDAQAEFMENLNRVWESSSWSC